MRRLATEVRSMLDSPLVVENRRAIVDIKEVWVGGGSARKSCICTPQRLVADVAVSEKIGPEERERGGGGQGPSFPPNR